jgi:hypothetical protein
MCKIAMSNGVVSMIPFAFDFVHILSALDAHDINNQQKEKLLLAIAIIKDMEYI